MKNLLALIGGAYIVRTIYEAGKIVGEVKGSIRTLKDIQKEFKEQKKKIWETEVRA